MNEIDFRELRRMERKKARSLHKWRNNCCIPDQNLDQEGIDVPDQSLPTNDPTISTTIRLPFQTLLQNELAEYHRIHPPRSKIDSVYYVKHFLPDDICQEFLQWLQTLPEYSRESKFLPLDERDESKKCNGKWTTLKHARRRVALFDATIDSLPGLLSRLAHTLVSIGAFSEAPNHVLINEYQKGMGIMAHTDGPAYESRTATISLGGDVLFKLTRRPTADSQVKNKNTTTNEKSVMEVLLHGCGSLIVFCNDAYLNHCHGIDEILDETTMGVCANEKGGVAVKRDYRVSLTFRCKKRLD